MVPLEPHLTDLCETRVTNTPNYLSTQKMSKLQYISNVEFDLRIPDAIKKKQHKNDLIVFFCIRVIYALNILFFF